MSYYLSIKSFQLDPRYIDAPKIVLGNGVDLEDPMHPIKSTYSVFAPEVEKVLKAEEPKTGAIKSQDIINESIVFKESLDVKEEGDVLSQYFKASYGLSSVNQSYNYATKQQKSHHTIYALLEHSGEAESLMPTEVTWSRNPESEMVGDPVEDKKLFVARYGSHYVDSIKYGLRIGIQAKVAKSATTSSSSLSAAFKASYGSFSVEAGVRKDHNKKLEEMGVEILFEATSGGRTDKGLVTVRGFESISKLLDDIGTGKTQFAVAPIQVTLRPYWPTLRREWKNTRIALEPKEEEFSVPAANYGVPKGTIIPWYPTGEYIKDLGSQSKAVTIVAPDGWAICDGKMGTPDLRDKFIRGTSEHTGLHDGGGNTEHNHGGLTDDIDTKKVPGEWWWRMGTPKQHAVTDVRHRHPIKSAEHLPPFLNLVFIMKL
jgi:hypothetical protein